MFYLWAARSLAEVKSALPHADEQFFLIRNAFRDTILIFCWQRTDDSTLGQYRVNFRRWKTYCDAKTGGDYSVKATVVLNFFHEVMFCLMTKKKISPEAGYSGQVGRAPPTGTNPFENAKGSTSKQPPQEEEEETSEGEERVTDQEEDGETYQEEEGEEEEHESGSWKSMEQLPDSDPTEWEITHSLCDNDDDNTNGLNQLLGATLTNLTWS
ncbi:hypothetical protein BGZ49_007509 [Haplosporangium sp. Z 27]|nr:hypothetical protein BGZ49_007509 [Haplosporangium sp. Z 27]